MRQYRMSDEEARCCRCGLAKTRIQIVPGRGEVPADILFLGEGPGKSEDMRGKAFIGRAGRLLNQGILRAIGMAGPTEIKLRFYFSNVVRCRPVDPIDNSNRQPTSEEAWACREWLERLYLQAKPKEVVFLGRVAQTHCRAMFPAGVHLYHPAYILRKGGLESTEFLRFARDLSEIFSRIARRRPKRI